MRKKYLAFFHIILYKKRAMAKKPFGKRRSSGKGRFDRYIIVGIIIALIVIILSLWGPLRTARKAEEKKPLVANKYETVQKHPEKKDTGKPGEASLAKQPDRTTMAAIVIDDLGQDITVAREILAIKEKITFAIMPKLPHSKTIAELAKKNNREVLLHLPMEYKGKNGNPAPGMLRSDMTPMELLNTISDDLLSVPGAVGVNNHEGSSLTENKEAMKFLMAELKARDLQFLDSVTTSKSLAYATAKEFGLKAAKRDVFLDNESNNPVYIRNQLEELAAISKKHGSAIGIGHPHPATISELRKWLALAENQGIVIVPISRLMH